MSINHLSTDLPEALWWSQQQAQAINMEPNPNSSPPPFKPPKTPHYPPHPSWPSFHWLKQSPPMFPPAPNSSSLNLNHQNDTVREKDPELNENELELEPMFEKPLTPSDVGKLNRLVIPKQHAEKYFPLSGESVEKGLLLSFEDELGKCWRFRYSYWNSSQSYVLTKGWSRYVKEKQLDAGDVVSFERHRIDGERLFIGWRRRGDNSSSHGGGGVHGNNGGGWSRGALHHQPYQHQHHHLHGANVTAPVPFQHQCLHAGTGSNGQKQAIGNSKMLRLFGVNMECQLDESEPSTPDGSSSMSSQGQHLFPSNSPYNNNNSSSNTALSHMDFISLSRDVNQMRNRRG